MNIKVIEGSKDMLRVYTQNHLMIFEPDSMDERDIRPELMRLIDNKDQITLGDVYEYFSIVIAVNKKQAISILNNVIKESVKEVLDELED